MVFKTPKESVEERIQKYKDQYQLNNISQEELLDKVLLRLNSSGNTLLELGTALQGNGVDSTKLNLLNTLVLQNWIIINQLDDISKKLDK